MTRKLAEIKEDTDKFGEVIARTLDVDVLIVDSGLKNVSNTFRYFDKFTVIQPSSVVGRVIATGETVTVRDRRNYDGCRQCADYDECEMVGFIGVPIRYQNRTVGAIALVLPRHRVEHIFDDIHNSVAFLENMADLLSSKIRDHDEYDALRIIHREREVLMDTIENAIALVDELGYVTYCNRNFQKFFPSRTDLTGSPIRELVPHKLVLELLDTPQEISNRLIQTDLEGGAFYGLLSCRNINIDGVRRGILLIFKSASYMSSDYNELVHCNGSMTFQWGNRRLFPQRVEEQAKRLSISDKPILLTGEHGTGGYILAKCIHQFSNRKEYPLLTINCSRLYRDLLYEMIFGVLGRLYLANNSTLLLHNIDQAPLYIQGKLADFIRTSSLRTGENGIVLKLNVRLIFSTHADLKEMARNGLFDENLYYRISENVIHLPALREEPDLLKTLIRSGRDFYCAQAGGEKMSFSPEVYRALMHYPWPGNVQEAEYVIDQIASHCGGLIKMDDLAKLNLIQPEKVKSMKEIEREMITAQLKSSRNKDDIAKSLGISRASLYRKIKDYNL